MKAAVIQSNYMPWRGYFDIMHDADVFVFYDDVQYTVNDWRNRNRVKTANGVVWLTIPVGDQNNRRVCDVEIHDRTWARKHWMTIEQSYSRAPAFVRYADFFRSIYSRPWTSLSVLNQTTIRAIADLLGIRTRILDSRDFDLQGKGSERLLMLLQQTRSHRLRQRSRGEELPRRRALRAKRSAGALEGLQSLPGISAAPRRLHTQSEHRRPVMNCGERAADYLWGYRGTHGSVAAQRHQADGREP